MVNRRNNLLWSEEEKELFKKLYCQGKSPAYIARKLQRTVGAMYAHVKRENLPNWAPRWNPQEERKLLALVRKGVDIEEISNELGRNISSITSKLYRMRVKNKTKAIQPDLGFPLDHPDIKADPELTIEGLKRAVFAALGFEVEEDDGEYLLLSRRR